LLNIFYIVMKTALWIWLCVWHSDSTH